MTSQPVAHPPAPVRTAEMLPLDIVLTRVGFVLSDLSDAALSVQEAISEGLTGQGVTRQAVIGFQGIDHIAQVIADIGRLLEDMAGMVPEGLDMDPALVLHRVSLAELTERIAGEVEAARDLPRRVAGEVMLF